MGNHRDNYNRGCNIAAGVLAFAILEKGHHLIMPPARLSVQNAIRAGMWTLSVRVNGGLLALHYFKWLDDLVDGYIQSDGEIDETYLQRLEDAPTRPLGIDELLSVPNTHDKPRSLPP